MANLISIDIGGVTLAFRPFIVDDLPDARDAANALLSTAMRSRPKTLGLRAIDTSDPDAILQDVDFDALDAANAASVGVLRAAVGVLKLARDRCLDSDAKVVAMSISATADETIAAALAILRGNRMIEEGGGQPATGEGAAGAV